MSKKIFKEKQRFTGWEVIALLAFFIIGLTFRFVKQHWISPIEEPMSALTYFAFIIPLAATLWYLVNLRLSVSVTEKNISVQYSPFSNKKHKIKWEDVEECEILSTKGPARTSGWGVTFDHEKRFSLIGRSGLHLKTKDGDNIVIGARNLKGLRQAVSQVLG
jgi:hypothetical protein